MLVHTFNVLISQGSSDLAESAMKLSCNHPYIGVVMYDSSIFFCVVAERIVLASSSTFLSSLMSLIAAYYAFDISYPTHLHPADKHLLEGLKDILLLFYHKALIPELSVPRHTSKQPIQEPFLSQ